jgi:hypothetical protein
MEMRLKCRVQSHTWSLRERKVVGDKWNVKVERDEEDVVVEDEVVVDDADTDTDTEAGLFHVVNPDQRPRAEPDDDAVTHAQLGETVNEMGMRCKRYNLRMLRRVQMFGSLCYKTCQ